jgi:hypothetical protein
MLFMCFLIQQNKACSEADFLKENLTSFPQCEISQTNEFANLIDFRNNDNLLPQNADQVEQFNLFHPVKEKQDQFYYAYQNLLALQLQICASKNAYHLFEKGKITGIQDISIFTHRLRL